MRGNNDFQAGEAGMRRDCKQASIAVLCKSFRAKSGCLEFQGARDRDGYGRARANGKTMGAHKIVYESIHGPVADGMVVMHTCDNPSCVEIDHLGVGYPKDNTADSIAKNRWSWRPPVYSEKEINLIRDGKLSNSAAKKLLGVSSTHFYRIKNGEVRAVAGDGKA